MMTQLSASLLAGRALVRLAPLDPAEDVRAFLQGLLTNDCTGALPVWAGLLSPQGKALHEGLLWADPRDPAAVLWDVAAEAADDVVRRLSRYRLRRAIAIARDDTLGVHWSAHEQAGAVPDPRLPGLGWRWLGAPEGQPADAAWLAHRLAFGVCEGLAELGSDQTLWLETNAGELAGVSFTKGCYVGQENTARMNWRSKVNRRLVVVPLDQSDPARQRAAYPDLGLAVDWRRLEDVPAALRPAWWPEAE